MDRRDVLAGLAAALPGFLYLAAERIVGPPMDAVLGSPWAPLAVVIIGALLLWLVVVRRALGPSRADLQSALDKVIDHIYVLPPATKPAKGITTQGIVQEHAPHNFRADWYDALGLPEPKPHRSRYR